MRHGLRGIPVGVSTPTARLHDRRIATPQSIAPLRRAVVDLAERGGATDLQCQDISLTVSEAVTNVVAHAYPAPAAVGTVAVEASLDEQELLVVVIDEGVGMPSAVTHPSAGLGLAIIAQAVDRLTLSGAAPGARVSMTFTIG